MNSDQIRLAMMVILMMGMILAVFLYLDYKSKSEKTNALVDLKTKELDVQQKQSSEETARQIQQDAIKWL